MQQTKQRTNRQTHWDKMLTLCGHASHCSFDSTNLALLSSQPGKYVKVAFPFIMSNWLNLLSIFSLTCTKVAFLYCGCPWRSAHLSHETLFGCYVLEIKPYSAGLCQELHSLVCLSSSWSKVLVVLFLVPTCMPRHTRNWLTSPWCGPSPRCC